MIKILTIVLLILSFYSCSNDKNEKILSIDEVSKGSEKYNENKIIHDSVEIIKNIYDNLSLISKSIIDTLNFSKDNVYQSDSTSFIDRFGSKKIEKWYMKNNLDSFTFYNWSFKDSNLCYSTFYNILDCFGKSCRSFIVGKDTKFYRNRSVLMLVQNTDIYMLESKFKIDFNRVLKTFNSKLKIENWKFIVLQNVYQKTNWYRQFDAKTIIEIKEK